MERIKAEAFATTIFKCWECFLLGIIKFGDIKLRSIETGLAAFGGVSAIQTFPVVQVQNPCPGFSVKDYSDMLEFSKGGNADQADFAVVIEPSGSAYWIWVFRLHLYYHKDLCPSWQFPGPYL